MIKVLFFGQLRERLDCNELKLELDVSLSLEQLKKQLGSQNERWEQSLLDNNTLVAVNQQIATVDCMVHPGDEIAFFPPVTGG